MGVGGLDGPVWMVVALCVGLAGWLKMVTKRNRKPAQGNVASLLCSL
jgi:hypothetical protein